MAEFAFDLFLRLPPEPDLRGDSAPLERSLELVRFLDSFSRLLRSREVLLCPFLCERSLRPRANRPAMSCSLVERAVELKPPVGSVVYRRMLNRLGRRRVIVGKPDTRREPFSTTSCASITICIFSSVTESS
jgi:hypothetical protein